MNETDRNYKRQRELMWLEQHTRTPEQVRNLLREKFERAVLHSKALKLREKRLLNAEL